MSAFTREVLADAAQSGAIARLQNGATVDQLNAIQTESWLALGRSCWAAHKEREDANAAAAGDELDRQLEGAA